MMNDPKLPDNPLAISWHHPAWPPILNPHNVMDYFSERTNPFYGRFSQETVTAWRQSIVIKSLLFTLSDRTCNNEVLKMQRVSADQLVNLQGIEYCLLHVQEPILYVIRKQKRHSPTQVSRQDPLTKAFRKARSQ